jgi:signal transduction histidine kinase/phage shock protein PspC (stress-responsive transcriptional regulator)
MAVNVGARPPVRTLRRARRGRVLGGVCAGLGRRLGIDPVILRIAFVAAALSGGVGILAYGVLWAFLPAEGERESVMDLVRDRRGSWETGLGAALLALSALLLFRELGLWFSDALVWPVVLAAGGAALIWRLLSSADRDPREKPAAPLSPSRPATTAGARAVALPRLGLGALGGAGLGAALVIGAALLFLQANDALGPARDVVLAVVVVLIGVALILAPWWWRLVRALTTERAERIRSQERAEVAAHLHDSVLQTLALIRRRADQPQEVAGLARAQERELRSWLSGKPPARADESLAAAIEAAAAEIEAAHGTPIEVVTVGDRPLDRRGEAMVAAAREALVNAAKFAGEAPISVYLEVSDGRVSAFVRDRGPGFDPQEVSPDRRGVRDSIIGRMERHGGRAVVRSNGDGTEVELELEGERA